MASRARLRHGALVPFTTVREAFSVPEGSLRIAIVADSHSAPHPRCLPLLAEAQPDHVLHAGDIGNLRVLDQLATIAPVSAVRGNIDEHREDIPDVRVIDVRDGAGTLITILLLHIAVNGPRLRADAGRLAQTEDASVVVCGHSHVPFVGRDRGRVVFNPGSIGPRRFQLPILFGLLEVSRSGVQMRHVDCETGLPWRPGPHPRI